MRIPLAAPVLLAALSACALPSTPYHASNRPADVPLRAQLLPGFGGEIGFHVDRPAYVAVVEVSPGRGATLLFPRFESEAFVAHAGSRSVWHSWGRYAQRGGGPALASWGGGSIGHWMQPRVFLLIASERPLRVDPYLHSSLGLRVALGGAAYGAHPYTMVDRLVDLLVPSPDGRDWVTDTYVEWPEPPLQPRPDTPPSHVITCRSGDRIVVPWWVLACPQDATLPPPTAGDTTAAPGVERPQRPDRRRPERGVVAGTAGTAIVPADRVGDSPRPARPSDRSRARPDGRAADAEPTREARQPRRDPERARPASPERDPAASGRGSTRPEAQPGTPSREATAPPRPRPEPQAQPARPESRPSPPRPEPRAEPRPASRPAPDTPPG